MNNRKSQKSRPSPELANEIISTTLEKNRCIPTVARRDDEIANLIASLNDRQWRGALFLGLIRGLYEFVSRDYLYDFRNS